MTLEFGREMTLLVVENSRLKGIPLLLPLRYLWQAVATWKQLARQRPEFILVQNPPVLAPLVCFWYARRSGIPFVIDSHSGSFDSRAWRWSLPLQKWLSAYAAATLVHNSELLGQTRAWRGKVMVAEEPPPHLQAPPQRAPLSSSFCVLVSASYADDEPLELVMQAAEQLPEVQFQITGDPQRASHALREQRLANVTLTGFLPRADYFARMASANAVMVLTTRSETMQRGACEGMYLGQPLILSDQPTLRNYFERGAVLVPNTVDGIVEGVRRVQARETPLRQEIQALARSKQQRWQAHFRELCALLQVQAHPAEQAVPDPFGQEPDPLERSIK